MTPTKSFDWIDNLRAIACFLVVLLHVSGPWVQGGNVYAINYQSTDWTFITFLHSLSRFCVPVFIMISGALLLSKKVNYKTLYSNRLAKVLRPFVFWTVSYLLLFLMYSISKGEKYTISTLLDYIKNALLYGAAYHLWYMYLILALYFVLPIFSDLSSKFSKVQVQLFLIAWFLILLFAQVFPANNILHYTRLLIGYFGYFILGYYLKEFRIKANTQGIISFMFIVVGLLATFLPVYYYAIKNAEVQYSWFYYLNTNVILLSIGVFMFFQNLDFKSNVLRFVSTYSFGVYLIHLIFIMILNKLWSHFYSLSISVLLFTFVCFLMSLGSVYLLKKIPVLKNYVA